MTGSATTGAPESVRSSRRILVIWNPAAGLPTTLRGATLDDLRDTLESHGIHADIAQPGSEDRRTRSSGEPSPRVSMSLLRPAATAPSTSSPRTCSGQGRPLGSCRSVG
jgi:hypothetical protein